MTDWAIEGISVVDLILGVWALALTALAVTVWQLKGGCDPDTYDLLTEAAADLDSDARAIERSYEHSVAGVVVDPVAIQTIMYKRELRDRLLAMADAEIEKG